MKQGMIHIYSGSGRGKSSAALGQAIQAANIGKKVIIIQFLKGLEETEILKRLEPEIKIFRFEKSGGNFDTLPEDQKIEEIKNIKNGLCFAKKVLTTGECDLLVLDEVLGLIDNKIITVEELKQILNLKSAEVMVIMTGIQLSDATCVLADEISKIETVKFKVF